MVTRSDAERLHDLIARLLAEPREQEWLEFKTNKAEPEEVGEYISALSNGAAIKDRDFGYLLWGVNDHRMPVGTEFDPFTHKVGNEDLVPWLARLVSPGIEFEFLPVEYLGCMLVLLRVHRAHATPTRFRGNAFMRVGSYKKPLSEQLDLERRLWNRLQSVDFESQTAMADCAPDEVRDALDTRAYFSLLERPEPESTDQTLNELEQDGVVRRDDAGRWGITALGAILFAKSLDHFGLPLSRKKLRVVRYQAESRVETQDDHEFDGGYAIAFQQAVEYLTMTLPSNEIVTQTIRRSVPMYPEKALRELIANALVHQDFSERGQGPMIEIFQRRLEITNPGAPLIDHLRFVDSPPKSRNEALASLMRRLGFCEERGSGWDKVAWEIEFNQLPAPLVEVTGGNTRVVLYAHKDLVHMDGEDRVRAVYLHACLRYVTDQHTNNTSVRERFGISKENSAIASRLIGDATKSGVIKPYEPSAAKRLMRYVPFWVDTGDRSI